MEAKGYWIVRVDVTDPEAFGAYAQAAPAIIATFGGRFLVRGASPETVEGSGRARNTVVEFPSRQAAIDCWNSSAYQAARSLREGAAQIDIVIVEGTEPA